MCRVHGAWHAWLWLGNAEDLNTVLLAAHCCAPPERTNTMCIGLKPQLIPALSRQSLLLFLSHTCEPVSPRDVAAAVHSRRAARPAMVPEDEL